MTTFVLKESEYDRAKDVLVRGVHGFAESKEFEQLGDALSSSPGLVCAAFTKFFARFQEEEIRCGLSDRDAPTLEDAYRAIEALSSSSDDSVLNLVQRRCSRTCEARAECSRLSRRASEIEPDNSTRSGNQGIADLGSDASLAQGAQAKQFASRLVIELLTSPQPTAQPAYPARNP